MRRVITQNLGKRLIVGKVYNFPSLTWADIAKSAKMDLEDFSEVADTAASRLATSSEPKIQNRKIEPVIIEQQRRGPGRPRLDSR